MTTFNACTTLDGTGTSSGDSTTTSAKGPTSEDDNRVLKIKRLKAKLINEEHRLVLMKKIRQSQTRPVNPQQQNINSNSASNQHLQHLTSHQSSSGSMNNVQGGQVKKLRPPHNQTGHQLQQQMNLQKNLANATNPLALLNQTTNTTANNVASGLNQTPAHAHQRPKVNTLWNPPPQQSRHPTPAGIAPPHVGNMSRAPITTPPNVVQAMIGSLTGQQSLLMNQINAAAAAAAVRNRPSQQQQQPQQSHQQSPFSKSTQAAAHLLLTQQQQNKRPNFKPSLQKQLEQTILQQQQQQQAKQQSGLGFPSNIGKRSVGISSPHVGNLSRQPITTPPNVVQDMRGGLSGQQSLLMNANSLTSSSSRRPQQQQSPAQQSPYNKSQATQLLLQKRTAAKSAIQKQLEQTIMQIPQKQIQLGIDFLPNANNIEFVYYVGLEACVDYLTNTKNTPEIQPLEKPYECSTCGTDFTPSWSWKRSNAVCENCVGNHVKKSIKNSHSNRIKSVLAKAAKQEQEIDQKIMAEAATVVSSPSTPTSSSSNTNQHSLLQPSSHQQQQSRSSNSQVWPKVSAPQLNSGANSRTPTSTPASIAASMAAGFQLGLTPQGVQSGSNVNPLAALQPAALASLLQMNTNPQLSTLASLMTANNNNNTANTNNNTNQLAQLAAVLMNQLSMNLWKR